MTIRSIGESIARSTSVNRSPADELARVSSPTAPTASAQISELHQLAPELSPELRQFLAARVAALPAAEAGNRRSGVLGLFNATRELDAAARGDCSGLNGMQHADGAGADDYSAFVEVSLARAEAAMLAALDGASDDQLVRLLGPNNPQSSALAAGLSNLAREMRNPVAFPPLRDAMAREVREKMRAYAAPPSPLTPQARAQLERVLDERFRISAPAERPADGQAAATVDNPDAPIDGESNAPDLGSLIGVSPAHAADYVPVRYAPRSEESYALFREAAQLAGVPESWATSEGLHNILQRESNGWVGKPNYTYGRRSRSQGSWGGVLKELQRGQRTAKSSATGLGQLILPNVDRYYPSGRAGIGVPVEEAAGMLAYIKDRYGTPERAWQLYGVLHEGY